MFVEPGAGTILLEIRWCFLPIGSSDTCLKKNEDDELIKRLGVCRV